MKYLILIVPPFFTQLKVLKISKYITKKVYSLNVKNILYRVKTRIKDDNPRKIFIRGNGKICTYELPPHCTLVTLEAPENEHEHIRSTVHTIASSSEPFYSEFAGVGDHGGNFTLFVRLAENAELLQLRERLYISFKKYSKNWKHTKYAPHITLLYDDSNSEKIKKARNILKNRNLAGRFYVNKIYLVAIDNFNIKNIDKFKLIK